MTKKKFTFRALAPKDLNDIYFCFLDSFSDYPINFRLNKEQFVRKFVEKLKMDFSFSAGAYDYEAMAGFIFTTINQYNGKLTAYNGGTGVRPLFRGNRLTQQMYDFLIPKFQEKGVEQCALEVLVNNKNAIKVYEGIGFVKSDVLRSFKSPKKIKKKAPPSPDLKIFSIVEPGWEHYEKFQDVNPSFLDTSAMITENIANEEIIEAHINGELAGYAIYQPAFARLSQMAVKPQFRRTGVGSELIHYILKSGTNELSVINVREQDKEMTDFFKNLGFTNHINQYEMFLSIS